MEECRKRQGYDSAGESDAKKPRAPGMCNSDGDDEEDILAWLTVDEETVWEMTKLLENEITSPIKVKFIDNPYSSPLIFQSSSSYVTINGNEESCGSSFSDADSSVMASIDMSSISKGGGSSCEAFSECKVGGAAAAEDGGSWVEDEEVAGYWADDGEWSGDGSNGSDCFDWDDVLARFLGEEEQ